MQGLHECKARLINGMPPNFFFQYKFDGDEPGTMRTVEEKIIVFSCMSAEEAFLAANARGTDDQRNFVNDEGVPGYFEFVGIVDLMHLGIEADEDEVWYDVRKMKDPMSRKESLLPEKKKLSAFVWESSMK